MAADLSDLRRQGKVTDPLNDRWRRFQNTSLSVLGHSASTGGVVEFGGVLEVSEDGEVLEVWVEVVAVGREEEFEVVLVLQVVAVETLQDVESEEEVLD